MQIPQSLKTGRQWPTPRMHGRRLTKKHPCRQIQLINKVRNTMLIKVAIGVLSWTTSNDNTIEIFPYRALTSV